MQHFLPLFKKILKKHQKITIDPQEYQISKKIQGRSNEIRQGFDENSIFNLNLEK